MQCDRICLKLFNKHSILLPGKSSFKFLLFVVYLKYFVKHTNNPLRTKVEFLGVPYNQTFDFDTGQFVKILTLVCS